MFSIHDVRCLYCVVRVWHFTVCTFFLLYFFVFFFSFFFFFFFFFFFQAEDGIRDHCVTGVQTCALPILTGVYGVTFLLVWFSISLVSALMMLIRRPQTRWHSQRELLAPFVAARSEERRVGKECRSRWWAGPEKKNNGKKMVVDV